MRGGWAETVELSGAWRVSIAMHRSGAQKLASLAVIVVVMAAPFVGLLAGS